MNNFDQDKFRYLVKALQQMVRCPKCGGAFSENDVELVAGVGQAYFVKMSCNHCGISVMASMMNMDKKVNNLGANSESEFNSEKMVDDKKEISADELIGLHEYLKSFKGDFKTALK